MLLAQVGRLLPWSAKADWDDGVRAALGDAQRVLYVNNGGSTSWLLERCGYEVEAFDAARDAYALPAPEGAFDAVFAFHLASRLGRPHHALSEWLRVLRPGGRLALMEPLPARGKPRLLDRLRNRLQRRSGPFRGRLDPREARAFLELADLRHVRVHGLATPFYLVSGRKV